VQLLFAYVIYFVESARRHFFKLKFFKNKFDLKLAKSMSASLFQKKEKIVEDFT
jgi:hypothetical protein